jgi:glycosyltransferase involved in cell wall biosynthesis
VVALHLGALSDLVADGVTGLLVPRASALSDALRALLTDSMRLQSMGLAAVDRVRARFDTLVVAPLLERLLLEVVQAAEPAAAS